MLGQAVLRAEEDEGGRHDVQQEREDDPEGGQEDRTQGARAPENSWYHFRELTVRNNGTK